jgi:non-homologous end joining protein Ku
MEVIVAVRPYWKGYLKLSLVTCAVTLSPATTEGTVEAERDEDDVGDANPSPMNPAFP